MVVSGLLFPEGSYNKTVKTFVYKPADFNSERVPKFKLLPGNYQFEVWGAQGGHPVALLGGMGGFSQGVIKFKKLTDIYIYCGEQGSYGKMQFGTTFNGGGANKLGTTNQYSGSGGGASDIRLSKELSSRLIVAGGGGGSGSWFEDRIHPGGFGGGFVGGNGVAVSPGSPGQGAINSQPDKFTYGIGSNGTGIAYSGGGGGGGYLGGRGSYEGGAGGGTGFLNYRVNGSTMGGNESITEPDGTNHIGHAGQGSVRITLISLIEFLPNTCDHYRYSVKLSMALFSIIMHSL